MITTSPEGLTHSGSQGRAALFADVLRSFYRDLLELGVPEDLARLVRRLDGHNPLPSNDGRRLAIIVEPDAHDRSLAAALLEETELAVVECVTAEGALAVLQQRGTDVAFIFADEHLAGPRDGIELAHAVETIWPWVRIVLTTDTPDGTETLPPAVIRLPKPWRSLDVLIEAERAVVAHA